MAERNLDFDVIIDRRNTKCLKYDFTEIRGHRKDLLPLWVADMDFKTSSYVEDALVSVAHHNIYGYSNTRAGDGFFEAVSGWMERHHNWKVLPEWHVKTPGVCFAIGAAIRAFSKPGEGVIIQQPVYYPFYNIIEDNKRTVVISELLHNEDGSYEMDFEDFEKKIEEGNVKLFILCNPHNPVGRVWTKEELLRIGKICREHNVIVFSDEIHFDFIWEAEHHIFQELDPSFKDITVTATSPSKTFNIAGLQQSNIFIPNRVLYRAFRSAIAETGYDEPNIFGIEASQAAYTHGDEWYAGMKRYVEENIDFACDYVKSELPGVKLNKPEGTYLIWLDFNDRGLSASELDDIIINKARLYLDSGKIFGKKGEGFQRINTACPRSILEDALERIKYALN